MSKLELPSIKSHPSIDHNSNSIERVEEDDSEDEESSYIDTVRIEEEELI